MTEENQGQAAEPVQQEAPTVEVQTAEEAAAASVDLGQHGHAAAQLEDPEHDNPHEQFQQ